MKKYISIFVILLALLMIVTGCKSEQEPVAEKQVKYFQEMHMEYPYRTMEELVQGSALIVRGKMVGQKAAKEANNLVKTDHIFEILEVYQGDKKIGDQITVEINGGVVGDTKYIASGQNEIKNGDEVLMILSYPTDDGGIISKDYYVFYPPAGIYYQESDGSFMAMNGNKYQTAAFKTEIAKHTEVK